MIRTLQQLADQGKLRNRDIDIIMVAAGFLSYEVVEEYLAHRDGQAASAPERPRLMLPGGKPAAGRSAALHEAVVQEERAKVHYTILHGADAVWHGSCRMG